MKTKQEILESAIQKAIDGGWKNGKELLPFEMLESIWPEGYPLPLGLTKEQARIKHLTMELDNGDYVNIEAVIYDKDFAKALWGEGEHYYDELRSDIIYSQDFWHADDGLNFHGALWQYHLQQMVIASDPIEYLEANI